MREDSCAQPGVIEIGINLAQYRLATAGANTADLGEVTHLTPRSKGEHDQIDEMIGEHFGHMSGVCKLDRMRAAKISEQQADRWSPAGEPLARERFHLTKQPRHPCARNWNHPKARVNRN